LELEAARGTERGRDRERERASEGGGREIAGWLTYWPYCKPTPEAPIRSISLARAPRGLHCNFAAAAVRGGGGGGDDGDGGSGGGGGNGAAAAVAVAVAVAVAAAAAVADLGREHE
jgi:hypothetical protein